MEKEMTKTIRLEMGQFMDDTVETDGAYQKKALLVYEGDFDSVDGKVKITPEHIHLLAKTHNGSLAKLSRLLAGSSAKVYPPVQLDHSTSATMTVGRLVGDVEIGEHQEDGKTKLALYGHLKILGGDNIEKVKDGRWTHLSIGADLDSGKINEISIVPFPAAKNASFLSQYAPESSKGEVEMGHGKHHLAHKEHMKKHLAHMHEHEKKMAEHEKVMAKHMEHAEGKGSHEEHLKHMEHYEEHMKGHMAHMAEHESHMAEHCAHMKKHLHLKSHLMKHLGMKEEEAENHLEKISDEEADRIAGEIGEDASKIQKHEKQEESEEHKAKMAAFQSGFATLKSGLDSKVKLAKLEAKKSSVMVRLAALKADAKITPAEIKKIDVVKLAGSTDETINAVLKSYEDRQPVIMTGAYGTKKAVNLAAAAKKSAEEKYLAEARKTIKLSSEPEETKKVDPYEPVESHKESSTLETEHHAHSHLEAHEHLKKLYAEGKHDEAHEYLKKMMGGQEEHAEMSHDVEKQVEHLSKAVLSLQTEFDNVVNLVESNF
jgi:hypothetical protein